MNKGQLVETIAAKSNLSAKQSQAAVNAFVETVKEALVAGDSVSLIGFGTFLVRERAARTGINPRTKETVQIAASKAPAFKPGASFKGALNK